MPKSLEYESRREKIRGKGAAVAWSFVSAILLTVCQPWFWLLVILPTLDAIGFYNWQGRNALIGADTLVRSLGLSSVPMLVAGVGIAIACLYFPRDVKRRVPAWVLVLMVALSVLIYVTTPFVMLLIVALTADKRGW